MKKFVNAERISMLTDGLFAIVMTLLVLELKIPHVVNSTNSNLLNHLLPLTPYFLAYIISFLLIGKYWQLHNFVFLNIHSTDAELIWYNLFFLLTISFIPFPTELLSQFHTLAAAIIIFNFSVSLPAVLLVIICHHLFNTPELKEQILENSDLLHAKIFLKRMSGIPIVALISTLASLVNSTLGIATWGLIIFVIFDAFWWKRKDTFQ